MPKKRAAGEGMVRKRSDGRYEVRVSDGYTPEGKQKVITAYTRTREEANRKRLELLLKAGKQDAQTSSPTLREWLLMYADSRKPEVRANTYEAYLVYIHQLEPIYNATIRDLKTRDLEELYRKLAQAKSKSLVNHVAAFVKAALKRAVRYGYIPANPAEAVEKPRMQSPEKAKALSQEEQNLLLEAARGTKYYPMLYLALSLGLRRGEILGLCWEDIDFKSYRLRIRRVVTRVGSKTEVGPTKTKASTRVLPLPADLALVLADHRKQVVEFGFYEYGWVFCGETGSPVTPGAFRLAFQRILKKAGLEHYRIHDLRHTFATRTLSRGADPKTVSGLLGHTTVAMTLNIYTHLQEEAMQKAVSELLENPHKPQK